MSDTNFIEYFPIPWSRHERKREMFVSYGAAGAVNAEVIGGSRSNDEKENSEYLQEGNSVSFSCQAIRKQDVERCELLAKTPCVPLFPPNNCK